jgi:hypothetical protein
MGKKLMSFVKCSDGITYYTGGNYYKSRGTLEQVKYGSLKEEDCDLCEDSNLEERILAACMSIEDSLYLPDITSDSFDGENEIISRLWGIYYGTSPYVRRGVFDKKYFYPAGM